MYFSRVGELCLQGEGWGGSTNDFHVSLISHVLVGALTAESLNFDKIIPTRPQGLAKELLCCVRTKRVCKLGTPIFWQQPAGKTLGVWQHFAQNA